MNGHASKWDLGADGRNRSGLGRGYDGRLRLRRVAQLAPADNCRSRPSNRRRCLNAGWSSRPPAVDFTGKERDAETGDDYFGARYLSSQQERFTTPDWSSSPEAVPYANLGDPQTLNLYAYVHNNPITSADADGHQEKEAAREEELEREREERELEREIERNQEEVAKLRAQAKEEADAFFNSHPDMQKLEQVDVREILYELELKATNPEAYDKLKAAKPAESPLTYEPNEKHGIIARGMVSAEPTNGPRVLQASVPIKKTSSARVGVDKSTGEYVMFRETNHKGEYHGYATRNFNTLPNEAKAALIKAGKVSKSGVIK
jgi:RHS repeat-associated protein